MATTTELPGSLPIRRTETPRTKPEDTALEFGTVFTDHMFLQDYEVGRGGYDPRIEPYQALVFDPAATVLHYAQAVFDGLKAFRQPDRGVRLFRPRKHAERLLGSSQRMCIPPLDIEQVLRSFSTLV